MFGGASFSELAFGEQDHVIVDTAAVVSFLADPAAERCILFEIDALSLAASGAASGAFSAAAFGEMGFGDDSAGIVGGPVTLTWSSHGYISKSTDTPASVWYDGRVKNNLLIERAITGRGGVGGLSRVTAQITLSNTDGALDGVSNDYAIDGRACRVLMGRKDDARAVFGTLFAGIVQSVSTSQLDGKSAGAMTFSLSDGLARLAVPVQATRYLGTGGTEGGDDLKGKPKPRAHGKVFNVTPPLVDSVNLIYQVNALQINDVPAVRDRGVALTKVAGAPAAGEYQVSAGAGTFKLGATPAGTITCDVEGDSSAEGYVTTTSDIVRRLLGDTLTTSEIDSASFANLKSSAGAPVGIWIGTEERGLDSVVDELLAGIGAFGGFSRSGYFTVGLVAAPEGASAASFTESEIKAIERQPVPAGLDPLVWRVQVGYQKNYTVQSDIAAGALAAARTFAAQPYRVSTRSDSAVKSRRLLAREYVTESLYRDVVDADAEAQRLFDLWGANRAPYRVKLPPAALICDIGSVVDLRHSRHQLANGKATRVIGYSLSGWDVELTVIA
jgi:hypothetical protein